MRYVNYLPWTLLMCAVLIGCTTDEPMEQLADKPEDRAAQTGPLVQHESVLAQDSSRLLTGQMIFTPAYSSMKVSSDVEDLSASHISIRNTSMTSSITLRYVDFYDDDGALVRNYLTNEEVVGPLGSRHYVIDQKDRIGGAGSNFIIEWVSTEPVTPPLIEAITVRYAGTRALAFSSTNVILRERR